MIVDAIIVFVLGLAEAFIGLVPEWTLPDGVVQAIGGFSDLWGSVDRIVPATDALIIVGFATVFALALGVWHGIVWVYEHLPFKAT